MAEKPKEFTVSFSKVFHTPKPKRARRAVAHLKKFMFKHFRAKPEQTILSNTLNETIWKGGHEKIPRKVEIQVLEEESMFRIFLKGEKLPEKKEKRKGKKKAEEAKKAEEKPKKEEKKEEEKTEEEIEEEKKLKEKKEREKAAEKSAIKRGKGK